MHGRKSIPNWSLLSRSDWMTIIRFMTRPDRPTPDALHTRHTRTSTTWILTFTTRNTHKVHRHGIIRDIPQPTIVVINNNIKSLRLKGEKKAYFLPPNQPETAPLASAAFCSTSRSMWLTLLLIFSRLALNLVFVSSRSSSSFSLPSWANSGMRLPSARALAI